MCFWKFNIEHFHSVIIITILYESFGVGNKIHVVLYHWNGVSWNKQNNGVIDIKYYLHKSFLIKQTKRYYSIVTNVNSI